MKTTTPDSKVHPRYKTKYRVANWAATRLMLFGFQYAKLAAVPAH